MKNKFTKGAWIVSSQGRDLIHINAAKPDHYAGLMTVAVLDTQPLRSGDELISEEEMQANAQLIAAAPEMLEALERVIKSFAPNGVEGLTKTQSLVIGNVMNAIAKARGES